MLYVVLWGQTLYKVAFQLTFLMRFLDGIFVWCIIFLWNCRNKYIWNRCDFTNNLAILFVGWSFLHLRCQQPAQPSLLMFIYLCRSKRIRLNQDSLMMGRNRQRELHQAVRVGVEYYQKQQCMHAQGAFTDCVEHHNFNLLWKTVHLLIRGYISAFETNVFKYWSVLKQDSHFPESGP